MSKGAIGDYYEFMQDPKQSQYAIKYVDRVIYGNNNITSLRNEKTIEKRDYFSPQGHFHFDKSKLVIHAGDYICTKGFFCDIMTDITECGVTANMPRLGRGDSGFESRHSDKIYGVSIFNWCCDSYAHPRSDESGS